jgi:hypothetical protein
MKGEHSLGKPIMELISLSPNTLSLFAECPRCFWLKVRKKIDRPRGPMPTIMSGLDSVIKAYYDQYRGKNELPPIVAGKIPGRLYHKVPPWLSMGDPETNTKLVGKLDELLEPEPGLVAPLDHKTRGKKAEEVHKAYQLQMDVYDLLLGSTSFKTPHQAWLIYYVPDLMEHEKFSFSVDVKEVPTDPERAREMFLAAAQVARGDKPQESPECEYCRWLNVHLGEEQEKFPSQPAEGEPF